MTKPCVVKNCKTGNKSLKAKRSVFKVPKNEKLRKLWESVIPNCSILKESHHVCERHFKPEDILRKYIKESENGVIIADVTYQHPRLRESVVPSIFTDDLGDEKQQLDNASCDMQLEDPGKDSFLSTNLENSDALILSSHLDSSKIIPSTTEVLSDIVLDEPHEENYEPVAQHFIDIPTAWSFVNVSCEDNNYVLFTYSTIIKKNNENYPATDKCIILDADNNFSYYIYGRHLNSTTANLPQILLKTEYLADILIHFQFMSVCKGINNNSNNYYNLKHHVFKDPSEQWHSSNCSLITEQERCEACTKLKSYRFRRKKQCRKISTHNILKILSLKDQKKLLIRKKYQLKRLQMNKVKKRLRIITKLLENEENKISSFCDQDFETKCSELNISHAKKLELQEILAAASKLNSKGRRYTEDWIMLCLLMNIRSSSYYEFLRSNNVIPLPCIKTIRNYFLLTEMKCGFDDNFGKSLKKHFQSKKPKQCHGIISFDQLNLRKSVSVLSKNLTYIGITDFDNNSTQDEDMNETADHGLVLTFHPLADSYAQTVAVFASKNSIRGEELAKIVVKVTILMERCGAKIHGLLADGALMNKQMWSLLGVSGSRNETINWFNHPMDESRKVFVFSDLLHIFKNVKNRLYHNRKLRISSKNNYIHWSFFEALFRTDWHKGNARVCPKITQRHVKLDNTSIIHAQLAIQIFSNSVANGLRFYFEENNESFIGCEETIAFCKQMNDIFDVLNRTSPNEGLTPDSEDFKVLQNTLQWLNNWELAAEKGDISDAEFLTSDVANNFRLTLMSIMELCKYMIEKFNFEYLLTGNINQDNLKKFFKTIHQTAESNDHSYCPTFLQLYKLLSIYSIIKPPKYGNCIVTNLSSSTLITIKDLEAVYGDKIDSKNLKYREAMKKKLNEYIVHEKHKLDENGESQSDNEYSLMSPSLNCIVCYVTGFIF